MTFDIYEMLDLVLRLTAATIFGGLLGYERELHGRWAGMRTHMTVALGSAVFLIVGVRATESNPEDVSRVVQGIAAGIGFLGAGTILKLSDQQEVKGLTTAGSIWLASAVGTAAGLAHYTLAVAAALLSMVVLALLRPMEKRRKQRRQSQDGSS